MATVTSQALKYDVIAYSLYEGLNQGSGTYDSRARCGSFDDGIWLAWYCLNTIATDETSAVIFLQTISNTMQHQKSH